MIMFETVLNLVAGGILGYLICDTAYKAYGTDSTRGLLTILAILACLLVHVIASERIHKQNFLNMLRSEIEQGAIQ
jgi:hypothetical protein